MSLDFEFSSWIDKEDDGITYHTVYSEHMNGGNEAFLKISSLLLDWREFGVFIVELETFEIEKEDWCEVWKKYFKIQHITDKIVVKPTWLEYEPTPEQVVVEIDPGMSFGTGKHATTAFCLRMLEKLSNNNDIGNMLDAGIGSGILTIAAHKLGYQDISAFDIDEVAVNIARENLELNNIPLADIDLKVSDLSDYNKANKKFDLVIANILGHILLANKERLVKLLHQDSYIVLSGVLTKEFDDFSKQFCDLGLKEVLRETEAEWTGGLFRFA
jgi:ribosomal protein L11 methyltransferase